MRDYGKVAGALALLLSGVECSGQGRFAHYGFGSSSSAKWR